VLLQAQAAVDAPEKIRIKLKAYDTALIQESCAEIKAAVEVRPRSVRVAHASALSGALDRGHGPYPPSATDGQELGGRWALLTAETFEFIPSRARSTRRNRHGGGGERARGPRQLPRGHS